MQINNPLPVALNTIQVGGISTVQIQTIQASQISPAADVNVMSGAAVVISAANLNRQELLITNTHATGNIRVGDSTVTATKGVRVGPNSTASLNTTAAVSGIAETALTVTLGIAELVR